MAKEFMLQCILEIHPIIYNFCKTLFRLLTGMQITIKIHLFLEFKMFLFL